MGFTLLRGENFRLFRSFEWEPDPALNLVLGANATGKTTLLEALFVLARGRSFRAQSLSELKGNEDGGWSLFGRVDGKYEQHQIGLGWSHAGTELRLGADPLARVADIARAVPAQIVDPTAHRLLEEGPAYRRSFIDWGAFHVEPEFLSTWRRYQRVLRQRNSALREGLQGMALRVWNHELSDSGERLEQMRSRHVRAASERLVVWTQRLLGSDQVVADWHRGWPFETSLLETVEKNEEQHRRMETTVQGPHRAELRLSFGGRRTKGRVSRGQQKMLIAAMILAQAELLIAHGCTPPVLLLDDFGSELAPEFQERLSAALLMYPGQKFITAFERPESFEAANAAVFHVEQGRLCRTTSR